MLDSDINDELEISYQKFCAIMSFNEGSWRSIMEFGLLIGSQALAHDEVNNFTMRYFGRLKPLLSGLNGPHGETLLKVYKVRRHSLMGRVTAPPRLVLCGGCLLIGWIKMTIKRGWQ